MSSQNYINEIFTADEIIIETIENRDKFFPNFSK